MLIFNTSALRFVIRIFPIFTPMKKEEIPQDDSPLRGWTREVCYAKNQEGKYERGLSTGWSVKADALEEAWVEVDRRVEKALQLVRSNQASPILYFMEKSLMDVGVLSHYTGIWKWRIRRHLKPTHFVKLNDKLLQKYAKAFEITIDQLKNFK